MTAVAYSEIGSNWKTSTSGSASFNLIVVFDPDTDDEADVQAAAAAALPSAYVGFNFRTAEFKEISYGVVRVTGNYARGQLENTAGVDASPDPSEFSFEIDSANVRIFSSLSVVASADDTGETSPDNGTLIGVQADGTVEGIEIPQMTYTFSEVHNFRSITNTYKQNLARLVGTVNFGAAFREGAAGEVMFSGVSGSRTGDDFWKLRYRFTVIPNLVAQPIGPFPSVSKFGWDYIEFFTRDVESVAKKRIEKKITGYKIHRVIRQGNFSLLGLGS